MAGRVESIPATASIDLAAVRGADLVLFSVKSTDTDAVAREPSRRTCNDDAIVLSLQNGVENADDDRAPRATDGRARRGLRGDGDAASRAWSSTTVAAIWSSARSTPRPRRMPASPRASQDSSTLFAAAGVPVTISADVDRRAVVEADGQLRLQRDLRAGAGAVRRARRAAVGRASCSRRSCAEVVARGRGRGRRLCRSRASLAAMERIAGAMPAQLSSTAQDMARRKPSEIDHLNGFVRPARPRARRADAGQPGAVCAGQAGRGAA